MSGESIHMMGETLPGGKPASQMQLLCWGLPCFVTCQDRGTQHVTQEERPRLREGGDPAGKDEH